MADKFLGFLGDLVKPTTGGGGSGGNYVYYSGTTQDFTEGVAMASIIRANMGGDVAFMPSGLFLGLGK